MAQTKPAHEIRLGSIRAAIWSNVKNDQAVWFSVTVSRSFNDGTGWRDSNSFRRDDLPLVSKIMDMAYAWIWDQEHRTDHNAQART